VNEGCTRTTDGGDAAGGFRFFARVRVLACARGWRWWKGELMKKSMLAYVALGISRDLKSVKSFTKSVNL
jgi:hypothetical protein